MDTRDARYMTQIVARVCVGRRCRCAINQMESANGFRAPGAHPELHHHNNLFSDITIFSKKKKKLLPKYKK
jgi:hypothetical protein